jgi:hypothetical protein
MIYFSESESFNRLMFDTALAKPGRTIPSGISRKVLASTSKDEFMSQMKSKHPEILLTRYNEILRYGAKTYDWRKAVGKPRVVEGNERLPSDLEDWRSNNPEDGNKPKELQITKVRMLKRITGKLRKSLCIVGPSRTCKTTWAESLGPHIRTNALCLQTLRSAFEADYAIFYQVSNIDNFPWQKFVTGKPFIRVWERYEPAEYIRWGIPSIFILNKDPRSKFEESLCNFWNSHVITVLAD